MLGRRGGREKEERMTINGIFTPQFFFFFFLSGNSIALYLASDCHKPYVFSVNMKVCFPAEGSEMNGTEGDGEWWQSLL